VKSPRQAESKKPQAKEAKKLKMKYAGVLLLYLTCSWIAPCRSEREPAELTVCRFAAAPTKPRLAQGQAAQCFAQEKTEKFYALERQTRDELK
jgi:hypothetical protein